MIFSLDELKTDKSFRKKKVKFKSDATNPSLIGDINPLLEEDGFKNFGKLHKAHLTLFGLLIVASFLLFVGKAFDLQILKSEEYRSLAQRNRVRTYEIPAPRGVIYDRNGHVIAQNRPRFTLSLDTSLCSLGDDLSLCEKIVAEVSRFLPENVSYEPSGIIKSLDDFKASRLILAKDLEKEDILRLESQKVPALDILIYPARDYLYPYAFSHLIGYTGLSSVSLIPKIEGKSGVEFEYEDVLSGVSGKKIIKVNSLNETLEELDTKDPVAGKNIVLFADIGLQKLAYEELEKVVEDPAKTIEAGVVVAQDPQTGGVLALVSYPAFDAQKMVSKITSQELEEMLNQGNYPFFNRAVSANYPPGSTFKMVMASAALEEGTVTPYTSIFDPGYISVAGYTFRNWNLEGHGTVDLLRALQVSNDTYFYTVGGGYGVVKGLGIDRISKWANLFGFGSKTGVDFPGEVTGFVPDSEYKDWYLGDTYITSIGQGDFLATPLQVNMATSYFANGSELLRPRVVKEVAGEFTEKKILASNLISYDTLKVVREGLRRAVRPGGTGYPVFDFPEKLGVELAGKTGTSEYTDPSGEERTHAWFTVWGPLEEGEIVLTIFLEGGGGGADDAAPIARTLLDYWFQNEDSPGFVL